MQESPCPLNPGGFKVFIINAMVNTICMNYIISTYMPNDANSLNYITVNLLEDQM